MKVLIGLAVAMSAALAMAATQPVDGARIGAAAKGEWLSHGRTYDEQRFSPLSQVNTQTVGKLGLAWWAQFDTDRGQEATPLVADGVLYTTTAWSKVYAFDAATGAPLPLMFTEICGDAPLMVTESVVIAVLPLLSRACTVAVSVTDWPWISACILDWPLASV